MSEFLRLLWGTVVYRPYVYGFFACFLCFSLRHLRFRGTLIYLIIAYLIAYACEYSATRNGFPFGMYVYLDSTRSRELWISNIPFWDSLSFVFLSYFSWLTAASILAPQAPDQALLRKSAALLGGLLMMALDVVIDPLTLLGDRWFLGKIYYYPEGGSYFGVTLSNFAGWWFVGSATLLAIQSLSRLGLMAPKRWGTVRRFDALAAWGVYAGILGFNLAITAWIKQWTLFAASLGVSLATLAPGLLIFARGAERRPRRNSMKSMTKCPLSPILLCAATEAEAWACRRGILRAGLAHRFEILKTGIGPRSAAQALGKRLARMDLPRPEAVISTGFAGGLGPETRERMWILGKSISNWNQNGAASDPIAIHHEPLWKWLSQAGFDCAISDIASTPTILSSRSAARSELKKAFHAVDMESFALAEVSRASGIAFQILRLISDTSQKPIPEALVAFSRVGKSLSALERIQSVTQGLKLALEEPKVTTAFLLEGMSLPGELSRGWTTAAPEIAKNLSKHLSDA